MTMRDALEDDFIRESQILLAVAEVCQREHNASQSWHVFEWMAYKLRCKYWPVRLNDQIINWDVMQ